jgi:hypothetical protein
MAILYVCVCVCNAGKFAECVVCGDGGDLLCCDACACSFHMACVKPAFEEVPAQPEMRNAEGEVTQEAKPASLKEPEGDWFCGHCAVHDACIMTHSPLGIHEGLRFWFVGCHIFIEQCTTGVHMPLSPAQVDAVIKEAGSTLDPTLKDGLEKCRIRLREQPIPTTLCDLFRVTNGQMKSSAVAVNVTEPEHSFFNVSTRYFKPVEALKHTVHWDGDSGAWFWFNTVISESLRLGPQVRDDHEGEIPNVQYIYCVCMAILYI